MNLLSLNRWQWLAVGVGVGLLVGGARRWYTDGRPPAGECITLQESFEQRLLTRIGGQPQFKNVFVSRQALDAGGGRREIVDLVTGKSCDGTVQPDGKYHWNPAYFIAPIPYRPKTDLRDGLAGKSVEHAGVTDFLRLARAHGGPSFTNAWWETYPFASRLAIAVIAIGLIWPCLIDLIVYGRLLRPRESKVRLPAPKPSPAAAGPSSILPKSDELPEPSTAPAPCRPEGGQHEPGPVLAGEVDPPAHPEEPHDPKHFGARPEDYYPTELRSSDS
jgi:hypothetical protein